MAGRLAAAGSGDAEMAIEPMDMSNWHNAEPSRTAGTLAIGAAPSATKVSLASCCHKGDAAEIPSTAGQGFGARARPEARTAR